MTKLDTRISASFRSERGARDCAMLCSVLASAQQRGLNRIQVLTPRAGGPPDERKIPAKSHGTGHPLTRSTNLSTPQTTHHRESVPISRVRQLRKSPQHRPQPRKQLIHDRIRYGTYIGKSKKLRSPSISTWTRSFAHSRRILSARLFRPTISAERSSCSVTVPSGSMPRR